VSNKKNLKVKPSRTPSLQESEEVIKESHEIGKSQWVCKKCGKRVDQKDIQSHTEKHKKEYLKVKPVIYPIPGVTFEQVLNGKVINRKVR